MEFETDLGKPWKYQDGDFTVIRSSVWSPPGCHPVGCGIKVYVDKDGRLDHIEGDENDPITQGRLCPRCLALKDYVYNPTRVIHPMKRAKEKRGDADAWERCSWDEALDIIMDNWKRLTDKYGRKTMAIFVGTGRDGMLSQDFQLSIFRTPNVAYTQSGYACYQPRMTASNMVLGALYPEMDYAGGLPGGYDDPQYKVPELMVMWGKMPLASNPDGMFGHAVIDLMKRGAKLACIDPRITWLSTRSVLQLRVRPGTDAALAMAMCNIIISEDLYDHDFVDRWTYGFDEFAERVKHMTPEKAAEICEVPVENIYKLARMYATAKPASIAWGLAFDQNTNGMQAGHCVLALMSITGNLDVPGGNVVADLSQPEDLTSDAVAGQAADFTDTRSFITEGWYQMTDEERQECLGMDKYPLYCNQITGCHADSVLDALETDKPYPVRFAWIANSNLLAPTNSADPTRWHKAFERSIDFAFGTDCFITPTIQATCDVFLPLTTVLEHDGVNRTHYGAASITTGIGNKAITVGECKSDLEIYCLLAERMASMFPDDPKARFAHEKYTEYHDYLNKNRLEGRHEFDDVKNLVKFKRNVYYRKYETGRLRMDGQPGFLTPTGRIELWSSAFNANGMDPLPYYYEPDLSPRIPDSGMDDLELQTNPRVGEKLEEEWHARDLPHAEIMELYPFILSTGHRRYSSFHSEHRQVAILRELDPNPMVEINPEDAERLGIADGQWCEISNMFGKAKYKARVTPAVRVGYVEADHGWWFPEQNGSEPSLFGVWQSNCNDMIPVHHNNALGFGAPYKCSCCNIVPLRESFDVDMKKFGEKFGELV
ncbi:MAG TPA: molybdopterin-dependent oxidoreductase [Coriobacteriaceae bacterium]|nr:molybdopterin-dependent oxidoreductase [Coriobacteriaceae bacterium]